MPAARRNPEKESLAGAAGDRVRAIIEAAEASAAEIRAEAEAEAASIRSQAEERASSLRSEVRANVRALTGSIREAVDRLRADLERLEARLGETEPEPQVAPASAPVAAPEAEEDPDAALAADAAVGQDETPAADHDGARLVALNMALDGAPREDVERRLRESHGLSNPRPLIDEVFDSLGR